MKHVLFSIIFHSSFKRFRYWSIPRPDLIKRDFILRNMGSWQLLLRRICFYTLSSSFIVASNQWRHDVKSYSMLPAFEEDIFIPFQSSSPVTLHDHRSEPLKAANCATNCALISVTTSDSRFHGSNTWQRLRGGCLAKSRFFQQFLNFFFPWLYFIAVQINTATMPKYIRWVLASKSHANADSKDAQSLSNAAKIYGNMCGIDSLFTFFSVNLLGCLSDMTRYRKPSARWWSGLGRTRRPYMLFSAFGLAVSQILLLHASAGNTWIKPEHLFYIAASMDGLTSCMLSQAQAHIADCNPSGIDLSETLSRFQGIAIGSAFFVGNAFSSSSSASSFLCGYD